jgi:hypothetical protein
VTAYGAACCYYAGHAALSSGGEDKRLAEAAGLFGRAAQRAAEARDAIQVRARVRVVVRGVGGCR